AAINDFGQIVGSYADANGATHGFIDNNGIFVTIDDPLGVNGTVLTGINNTDQIVGYYVGADGHDHGFETTFSTAQTAENSPLILNTLAVDDPAAGTQDIQVEIAVGHGTLNLESRTNLTVSFTTNSDMTLTGTVTDIDAALAKGVVYAPDTSFKGD